MCSSERGCVPLSPRCCCADAAKPVSSQSSTASMADLPVMTQQTRKIIMSTRSMTKKDGYSSKKPAVDLGSLSAMKVCVRLRLYVCAFVRAFGRGLFVSACVSVRVCMCVGVCMYVLACVCVRGYSSC